MRACLLLGSWGWGGAERQALMIAEGLMRRPGFRISVAALGPDGPVRDRCRALGLRTLGLPRNESRFPLLSWLRTTVAAELLVSGLAPDAILAFTSPANLVAGWAAMRHGTRAVWGQRDEGLFRFHSRLERRAFRACCAIVANGPGAAGFAERLALGLRPVNVIPNGVRAARPLADRGRWRERLGIPQSGLLVTMVANLTRTKDHPTLLDAWRGVEDRFPGAYLVLAGRPGDGSDAVAASISSLGLQRVLVIGQTDDTAGLNLASEVAVLSSRSEGQSNAVLEAMACGLPVIATDTDGCRSVLPDGPLVPPGDARALTEALGRMLADAELRATTGGRNARHVQERFSAEACIDRYAAILSGACASEAAR